MKTRAFLKYFVHGCSLHDLDIVKNIAKVYKMLNLKKLNSKLFRDLQVTHMLFWSGNGEMLASILKKLRNVHKHSGVLTETGIRPTKKCLQYSTMMLYHSILTVKKNV